MTPKQTEKLKKKIADIKRILAAEKKSSAVMTTAEDSGTSRPVILYSWEDYKGGVTYLKWFYKNFPDDGGFPEFPF